MILLIKLFVVIAKNYFYILSFSSSKVLKIFDYGGISMISLGKISTRKLIFRFQEKKNPWKITTKKKEY